MNKQYMVLDGLGNPLSRMGDEANPYIFYSLKRAVKFADSELDKKGEVNNYAISVVEIRELERRDCDNK